MSKRQEPPLNPLPRSPSVPAGMPSVTSRREPRARQGSERPARMRWDSNVETREWLESNGMKARELTLNRWLPAIGFKHSDGQSPLGLGMFRHLSELIWPMNISCERLFLSSRLCQGP